MWLITVLISVILSVFSTTVMSYIAMATPIGPWIAPTLVLFAMLLIKVSCQYMSNKNIALAVSSGSIGGILATACGFYFPTLYFLDQSLFNAWMARPLFFICTLGGLSFVAGWFGMVIANIFEQSLVVEQKLAFPIGQLVHKTIAAQNQIRKAYELMIGFVGTGVFCVLQNGTHFFQGIFPRVVTILAPMSFGVLTTPLIRLHFDILPMVWAIGFVTGHVVALPLGVGALAKTMVVDPLNRVFFSQLSNVEFVLAFCSGMVLMSALLGMIATPKHLWKTVQKVMTQILYRDREQNNTMQFTRAQLFELGSLGALLIIFLSYFNFSLAAQLYLIVFAAVCTYQIAAIAGKIGLALMGRFATFVMVPAIILFDINAVQIVFIASFVGIAGGVAADVLFSRKLALLAKISSATMKKYQLFGLLVSSLCVGVVFWLLINRFGLGSPELFAYRAQSRQLLIQAQQFNYLVLAIGAVFGFVLKKIKLNPMLVLGGLLMPINITLGLVIGGMLALLPQDHEEWYPFWSGVFASNSIWMLIRTMM